MRKRPNWSKYYLNIAKAISIRSTCINKQVGAVIVSDNVIISTGYNGAPRGQANCTDIGECEKRKLNIPSAERLELCRGVCAEENAIINGAPDRMKGATIYIWATDTGGNICNFPIEGKPCRLCIRILKNARIDKVVYWSANGIVFENI